VVRPTRKCTADSINFKAAMIMSNDSTPTSRSCRKIAVTRDGIARWTRATTCSAFYVVLLSTFSCVSVECKAVERTSQRSPQSHR
jgi:hypothetical protein